MFPATIIANLVLLCKGAFLVSLRRLHISYRLGDFTQSHLRNVAGGDADGVKGLGRVEVDDCPEVLTVKILCRIYAAAGHQHIGYAVSGKLTVSSFDCLADDYMTKPFSMVVLGKRITALLRRAGVKDEPNIWKYGELTVDFSGYSACNQNGKIDITPKEIELLKLLLDHKGLVLSRSQILNAVWGDDSYVIDRIVDSYIRNLRKKLGLDCIVTVKGIGYKLEVGV